MFDKLIAAVRDLPDWLAGQLREISGEAAEERRRLMLRAVEPSLSYREARVQVELAVAESYRLGRSVCEYEDAFHCFLKIMSLGYRSGIAIGYLRAGLLSGIVQGERSGAAWAQLLASGWDRDAFRTILEHS